MINATGVLVHTNLGRAPLAQAALDRVAEVGGGYSNLEYDLADGSTRARGRITSSALLRRITGAEAALVVNNNAAAVLLALAALAEGREVLVSRGELIEIGDGFRIPDVLARSGARLVEVGTTNRTRAADYERAIGPETALVLRVHQSNFRVVGFTEQPGLAELAELAHAAGCRSSTTSARARSSPSATSRRRRRASPPEPTSSASRATSCSAGRRPGIVAGRADLVERLRRHPLQRALRADKLTLAALEGTLALALDPERARREIPVLAHARGAARRRPLAGRAARRARRRRGGGDGRTGRRRGACRSTELPSFACAVEEALFEPLRLGEPPVVGIVRDGRCCSTSAPSPRSRWTRSADAVVAARAAARDGS